MKKRIFRSILSVVFLALLASMALIVAVLQQYFEEETKNQEHIISRTGHGGTGAGHGLYRPRNRERGHGLSGGRSAWG